MHGEKFAHLCSFVKYLLVSNTKKGQKVDNNSRKLCIHKTEGGLSTLFYQKKNSSLSLLNVHFVLIKYDLISGLN